MPSASTKTALITGASSGIGKEFAVQLASEGYDLVLVARRADRLEALGAELTAKHSVSCTAIPLNLAEHDACERLMNALEEKGLGVDLCINNAGFGQKGKYHEVELDRQLAMIDVNCRAVADLTHRMINHMLTERKETAEGLINLASVAAWQPGPWMSVYFASKAFVLHFSEAVYEDVKGQGLTVTALCPGGTHTEFGDIADMADAISFKFGAMTPPPVVKAALSGFRAKQAVVVPGLFNKLAALFSRFGTRAMRRGAAGKVMNPGG